MNTVPVSLHSQRKPSARRKVSGNHHSSTFGAGEKSKQSLHANNHHRFATPSPIKDFSIGLPPKTAPVRRLSPIHPSKLHRGENGKSTPTKHHFLSSPLCPPSPHHKPRASSPLRKPTISPIVTIKRPQNRLPLGEIRLSYHNPGSGRLFEDVGRGKSNNGKSSNKENIPPFTAKEIVEGEEFVRPLPREALKKLVWRSEKKEEVVVTEERVVSEDITTEYFAGARIITEKTHKMSVSTTQRTKSDNNPEDQQKGTKPVKQQSNIQPTKQLNSLSPMKKSWDFEIYHDDSEDLELLEYNTGLDHDMLEEEDKENTDPGAFGGGDESDWHGERQPKSHKRKLVEDWN